MTPSFTVSVLIAVFVLWRISVIVGCRFRRAVRAKERELERAMRDIDRDF